MTTVTSAAINERRLSRLHLDNSLTLADLPGHTFTASLASLVHDMRYGGDLGGEMKVWHG